MHHNGKKSKVNIMKQLIKLLPLALSIFCYQSWAGEKIDLNLEATPDGRVTIDNMRGKITIIGWDKNLVHVKGEIDDSAKSYEFRNTGNRIMFEVEMPRFDRQIDGGGEGSDLVFYIPKASRLDAEGVQVNFTVSGLSGSTDIDTINGNIVAKNLSQEIELRTINGSIDSENLSGEIEMTTVNGSISDSHSEGVMELTTVNGPISSVSSASEVEIESVNSVIDVNFTTIQKLNIRSANARIKVGITELAQRSHINVDSVSGQVELSLPTNVSADFSVQNHAGGGISNSLSADKPHRPKYGPGRSLDMSLNGGNAEVSITTVNAKVSLKPN